MSTLARALSWFLQPAAQRPAEPSRPTAAAEVTSAAVLGRRGEAEPVAAALALALTRHARTRAATVAVLALPRPATGSAPPVHARAGGGWSPPAGAEPATPASREWFPPADAGSSPTPGGWSPPAGCEWSPSGPGGGSSSAGDGWSPPSPGGGSSMAGGWSPPRGGSSSSDGDWSTPPGDATEASPAAGGSRAARRLAARLAAHGLPARARGRLAWVALPLADGPAAARRAVVAGAPAVLAVTAPRTRELDDVLAEQDLVVLVAAEPDGPLARLAALPKGAPPLVVVRPLRRGPARSLACAGLAAPREIRALFAASRRVS